jgi:hypothetical protein
MSSASGKFFSYLSYNFAALYRKTYQFIQFDFNMVLEARPFSGNQSISHQNFSLKTAFTLCYL